MLTNVVVGPVLVFWGWMLLPWVVGSVSFLRTEPHLSFLSLLPFFITSTAHFPQIRPFMKGIIGSKEESIRPEGNNHFPEFILTTSHITLG